LGSGSIEACSVDQLDPNDLVAVGQTACLLGAMQLLDRVLAQEPALTEAVPTDGTEGGVDPAQLLATGYAACLLGALRLVLLQRGTEVPRGSLIRADVAHGGPLLQGAGLTVALRVSLPGLDQDAAAALVRQAHETCPYSHMSRSDIDVRLAA
jgi:Ohr subfamily peroxiredoxin